VKLCARLKSEKTLTKSGKLAMDKQILIDLVTKTMPYGKYKGRLLCDIPEHYLVWMHGQGFPEGKLGMWLHTLYEIRLNGLEGILAELRKNYSKIY
jgi:uncharacterized protein (DUF3820 family)